MGTYTSLPVSFFRNLISPHTQYAASDGTIQDRDIGQLALSFERIAVFCTRLFSLLFVTFRWETDRNLYDSLWEEIKSEPCYSRQSAETVNDLYQKMRPLFINLSHVFENSIKKDVYELASKLADSCGNRCLYEAAYKNDFSTIVSFPEITKAEYVPLALRYAKNGSYAAAAAASKMQLLPLTTQERIEFMIKFSELSRTTANYVQSHGFPSFNLSKKDLNSTQIDTLINILRDKCIFWNGNIGFDNIAAPKKTYSKPPEPKAERPKKANSFFNFRFDELFSNFNRPSNNNTNTSYTHYFFNSDRPSNSNPKPSYHPTQPAPFTEIQKPVWKCPEVLAKHTAKGAAPLKNILRIQYENEISLVTKEEVALHEVDEAKKNLCSMLQISVDSDTKSIKKAKLNTIKLIHPDMLPDELKEFGRKALSVVNFLFDKATRIN